MAVRHGIRINSSRPSPNGRPIRRCRWRIMEPSSPSGSMAPIGLSKLVKSSDHGATWTAPVVIAPGLRWTDHPWLVVSPDGQDVYVGLNKDDSYIVTSHDGGQSFETTDKNQHPHTQVIGGTRTAPRWLLTAAFTTRSSTFFSITGAGPKSTSSVPMTTARAGRPRSSTVPLRLLAAGARRVASTDFFLPPRVSRSTKAARS